MVKIRSCPVVLHWNRVGSWKGVLASIRLHHSLAVVDGAVELDAQLPLGWKPCQMEWFDEPCRGALAKGFATPVRPKKRLLHGLGRIDQDFVRAAESGPCEVWGDGDGGGVGASLGLGTLCFFVQVGPNIVEEIGGERGDQDEQLALRTIESHGGRTAGRAISPCAFPTSATSSFLKGAAPQSPPPEK